MEQLSFKINKFDYIWVLYFLVPSLSQAKLVAARNAMSRGDMTNGSSPAKQPSPTKAPPREVDLGEQTAVCQMIIIVILLYRLIVILLIDWIVLGYAMYDNFGTGTKETIN